LVSVTAKGSIRIIPSLTIRREVGPKVGTSSKS
jgi:hypothetical protein